MFSLEKENFLHAGSQLQPEKTGQSKLAPKTPMQQASKAPKTPFRVPLDRENMDTAKRVLTTKRSAFQLDPSAFVTPVCPRRVPLGGKTTNAKAPTSEQKGKLQLKLQSPHPKSMIRATEEETADIEYMPPKPDDLPDIPDDFIELDYNLLKNNMFCGVYSYYLDAYDENGKTKLERQMDARMEELDREMIAEADGIILPKNSALKKSISIRRDAPTAPIKAMSRPASKAGRQTPTESKRAVPVSGTRSNTPAETSRPPFTTKSSSTTTNLPTSSVGSTSRPTSRVGRTSRPTSRAGSTSRPTSRVGSTSKSTSRANLSSTPIATQPNKPRTVSLPDYKPLASSASILNHSMVHPAAVAGKSGEVSGAGLQINVPLSEQSWELQLSKTLQEDEEELIRELMYANNSDDDERLGLNNIPFEDDDSLFQL